MIKSIFLAFDHFCVRCRLNRLELWGRGNLCLLRLGDVFLIFNGRLVAQPFCYHHHCNEEQIIWFLKIAAEYSLFIKNKTWWFYWRCYQTPTRCLFFKLKIKNCTLSVISHQIASWKSWTNCLYPEDFLLCHLAFFYVPCLTLYLIFDRIFDLLKIFFYHCTIVYPLRAFNRRLALPIILEVKKGVRWNTLHAIQRKVAGYPSAARTSNWCFDIILCLF